MPVSSLKLLSTYLHKHSLRGNRMKTNEFIGYYDYYYDKHEYSHRGKGHGTIYEDYVPSDLEKFFYNDKICPFCGTSLKQVFAGTQSATIGTELFLSGDVFECPKCKWWTYKTHFVDSDDNMDSIHAIYTDTRYYAITKKFNIDDKNLPIDVLTSELQKRTDLLYHIDPYKLEELSQSILKGIYDCQVHHVGKTGDGGIDLIVLDGDDPILVQIKRRQNPNHVELVKNVREFVGTLFIEGKRRGIYISTADKFSKGSKETADKLLRQRKLDYFELIDYQKLCSLIKTSTSSNNIWQTLVEPFYTNPTAHYYDTEDSIQELNSKRYIL